VSSLRDTGLAITSAVGDVVNPAFPARGPPPGTLWSSGLAPAAPARSSATGDFGPWNGVWHGGHPVGLIDFDHARPAPPIFGIAYALEYAAPFRDDSEGLRWPRYSQPPDRRRRIEIFCDAYGIPVPADITSRVAWQQRPVLQNCQALASQGIEPQATWVREGYLDTVRARSTGQNPSRSLKSLVFERPPSPRQGPR
jgi:hypothetical protein